MRTTLVCDRKAIKEMGVLDVLLTVDTEVHAINPEWKQDRLQSDILRDIEGSVGDRSVGLGYQLDALKRNDLKATFMVDPMFAAVPEIGKDPLDSIVSRIRAFNQEIQLHLHCEWIQHIPSFSVPYRGYLQHNYNEAEQSYLISFATRQLQASGAPKLFAFRAGGFGANESTILALKKNGFKFDSSFNIDFPHKCRLPIPPSFGSPFEITGIKELSIAAFHDYPGHWRPAQLGACGYSEMIDAIEKANRNGWRHFVILSHTFEMLNGRWQGKTRVRNEVVGRFEKLCKYLKDHKDRFRTVTFGEIQESDMPGPCPAVINGKLANTFCRFVEQGLNRIRSVAS